MHTARTKQKMLHGGQAAPIEKVSIRSQHRAGEDIDMTVRGWSHRAMRMHQHTIVGVSWGDSGRTACSRASGDCPDVRLPAAVFRST